MVNYNENEKLRKIDIDRAARILAKSLANPNKSKGSDVNGKSTKSDN